MESFANLTDEMLVKLYAGGNNSAFDILLERYEEKICFNDFFIPVERFFLISFLLCTIKMWLMIYSRKRL